MQNTTIVVNINGCLQHCGLSPDVPPLNPSDPTVGPSTKPLNRSMVQVICVRQSPDGQATDCTSHMAASLAMQLGWSVMSPRVVAAALTFTPEQYSAWTHDSELLQSEPADFSRGAASATAAGKHQGGVLDSSGSVQYQYCGMMDF